MFRRRSKLRGAQGPDHKRVFHCALWLGLLVIALILPWLTACAGKESATPTTAAPSTTTTVASAPSTTAPPTTEAELAIPMDRIAFIREVDAGGEAIWTMDALGEDVQLLSDQVGDVRDVAWSKDGSSLAILSGSGDDPTQVRYDQVWIMAADGSGLQQVDLALPASPKALSACSFTACDWSPDGTAMALTASYPDDNASYGEAFAVLLLEPSTGTAELLGSSAEDLAWGDVVWLLDGSAILLMANSEDAGWLWSFDPETGEKESLQIDNQWAGEEAAGFFLRPYSFSCSPDGALLASAWGGYDYESQMRSDSFLVVSDTDGSKARLLFRSGDSLDSPSISPDGESLAFSRTTWDEESQRWGASRIGILPLDGSAESVELGDGTGPAWQPLE